MRKSQITIFIFLALIVLFLFMFVFKFAKTMPRPTTINQDTTIVSAGLSECLEESANAALLQLSQHGTLNLDKYFETNDISIEYYPETRPGQLQTQIKTYMLPILLKCSNSTFQQASKMGATIMMNSPSLGVVIKDNSINFFLNYTIILQKNNLQNTLKDFIYKPRIREGSILFTAADVLRHPMDSYNLTELSRAGNNVIIASYFDGTDVVAVEDPRSEFKNKDYIFSFSKGGQQ